MANSVLGVYNLALQHLSMKKITAVDTLSPAAVACDNYYETCRDDCFREHKWPFATVQATLNAAVATIPLGWVYAYDYPTQNIATVWSVFNEGTYDNKDGQDFEVYYNLSSVTLNSASRLICSDLDDAYYEGTYIITDPTVWDMKFYLALSYKLAASMSGVLTGDTEKGLKLMQVYNAILGEAKRISSSEQKKKPPRKSEYQASRG